MKDIFPKDLGEARELQKKLAERSVIKDTLKQISKVGALDVAYKEKKGYVAGIIFDLEERKIVETKALSAPVPAPYIPTFLFLREVPFFLEILSHFTIEPDIFLIDGHGIAHPYYAGSATIFGVLADKPSIGVAKKPLKYFKYIKSQDKNLDYIEVKERKVGVRFRIKENWNPIFISPGHKVTINTAFKVVSKSTIEKYKLPIPLRIAHYAAAEAKNSL
ncbi:MAG: endonuclease V [Candidatus Heimdallarchaeaceae archaeon]|jgi:deoxyribonuclease V